LNELSRELSSATGHPEREVRAQMTMAGQTMQSRLKIEGERVGECP